MKLMALKNNATFLQELGTRHMLRNDNGLWAHLEGRTEQN